MRKLSTNEKLLIALAVIFIVLIVFSKDRISRQLEQVYKVYSGKEMNFDKK
ncbi:MAG TPA: hypothetical protein PLQ08_02875 [Bacteroidales bacterium]|jgi:hypothetical protein|nr:hypothetical protein [Bacteroidales bacterium]